MSVRRALKFDEKRSLEIYYSLCNAMKGDISRQIFSQPYFLSGKRTFQKKSLKKYNSLKQSVLNSIELFLILYN